MYLNNNNTFQNYNNRFIYMNRFEYNHQEHIGLYPSGYNINISCMLQVHEEFLDLIGRKYMSQNKFM